MFHDDSILSFRARPKAVAEKSLNGFMYLMSLNVDGCERSCRAEIFTCAASDAPLFEYSRDHERVRVIRVLAYHSYRSVRAVACAVAAAYTIGVYHTVVEVDHGVSDLDG